MKYAYIAVPLCLCFVTCVNARARHLRLFLLNLISSDMLSYDLDYGVYILVYLVI